MFSALQGATFGMQQRTVTVSDRASFHIPIIRFLGLENKPLGDVSLYWQHDENVGDVWDIKTTQSKAKHYATFNTQLIDKPIKAGCPEGGIILDPFCGSGTTGVRALQLNRRFIGIDVSAEYLAEAKKRLQAIAAQPQLF